MGLPHDAHARSQKLNDLLHFKIVCNKVNRHMSVDPELNSIR